MSQNTRSPAELRSVFGENLKKLSLRYASISELSRQLGINRTQFNRYLSGESFPRPDVLHRICSFFDVDARILLDPVDSIQDEPTSINSTFLKNFLGFGTRNIDADAFPDGFFRFTRRSFLDPEQFIVGLVFVFRQDGNTFVRGFEARDAMRRQGLPLNPTAREFRGIVSKQDEGISLLISRYGARTNSFNFLSRVSSFENNFWSGYVVRTMREELTGTRAQRMVYEHLGPLGPKVLQAARTTGYKTEDEIMPFHKQLLRPEEPFR